MVRCVFHISPDPEALGPPPESLDQRVVDYEVTVTGQDPQIFQVPYDTPLDMDIDAPGYDLIKIRVRWPWASSDKYRNFQEPYGKGRL